MVKCKEAPIIGRLDQFKSKVLHILNILPLDKILRFTRMTRLFKEYFKGLEKNTAVNQIFGEKTEEVLHNLKVEFTWMRGYMWINRVNGNLVVSSRYLRKGDKIDIYLDLIHELVHVKQFMEGKKLFDKKYSYIERPTEIEAYRYTVEEARRLKLNDDRICQYLKIDWISQEDFLKLAKILNVKCAELQNPV